MRPSGGTEACGSFTVTNCYGFRSHFRWWFTSGRAQVVVEEPSGYIVDVWSGTIDQLIGLVDKAHIEREKAQSGAQGKDHRAG